MTPPQDITGDCRHKDDEIKTKSVTSAIKEGGRTNIQLNKLHPNPRNLGQHVTCVVQDGGLKILIAG